MNKTGFGFLRLPQKGDIPDWNLICDMTDRFMEAGGRLFDTCYTYLDGMSEEAVRRCIVQRKERNSFLLMDKLPGYQLKTQDECRRVFNEELLRCGVDYFDVYLLQGINAENDMIAEEKGQYAFLREIKRQGLARRTGFSYHGGAQLLDGILTRHPETDVVLLQINYLDWDTPGIESRACYETCVKHGKSVFVMEPVKGGTLAALPQAAEEKLRRLHPDWQPAWWALRFVQSLPRVEVCLSGMNTLMQIEENMRPFAPLNREEIRCLMEIRSIIHGETAIACTGCGYCVPRCPKRLPIPELLSLYNSASRFPEDDWKLESTYLELKQKRGCASGCMACGNCEKFCPQGIRIREWLNRTAAKFE